MAARLLNLLEVAEAAGRALCFAVVLPGWTDCEGYQRLHAAARWLRSTLLVAASDHGFVDGGQYARPHSKRESPYDTRLFVLQTDAHAAAWPVADSVMAELERAFALCTPSSTDLANVDSSERVHRNGTGKKRARRKMKRAGKKARGAAAAERGHGS